mmetsp:Transcript_44095/g.112559  ORF Transcript_44095/g.112559 Transcript_44095/m.112559 type:complete len:172 (-) Transcript_44095:213-728(-)
MYAVMAAPAQAPVMVRSSAGQPPRRSVAAPASALSNAAAWARPLVLRQRPSLHLCRAAPDAGAAEGSESNKPADRKEEEGQAVEEEDWDGLTEEEDWVVPGGANDSLSSNTPLGRAIRSACDELDELGQMERDVQAQAEALLRQLGYKGDSLTRKAPSEEGEAAGEEGKSA